MLSIFDGYKVRDLSGPEDVAAITALDDATRDCLFACKKACDERDLAESRMVAARSDVRTKENIAIDATNTYNGLKPVRDTVTGKEDHGPKAGANLNAALKTKERYAAQQAVIAAQQPGYVPARVKPSKFKIAMEKANTDLEIARVELRISTTELHRLERIAGEATNAWRVTQNNYYNASLPEHIARSQARDKLLRDTFAAQNAERVARVARGEPAEPPQVGPVATCEWERARGAGKRKVRPLIGS